MTLPVPYGAPPAAPPTPCTDPRPVHPHWCGFCGAEEWTCATLCAALSYTPRCPRCGETDRRSEVDRVDLR